MRHHRPRPGGIVRSRARRALARNPAFAPGSNIGVPISSMRNHGVIRMSAIRSGRFGPRRLCLNCAVRALSTSGAPPWLRCPFTQAARMLWHSRLHAMRRIWQSRMGEIRDRFGAHSRDFTANAYERFMCGGSPRFDERQQLGLPRRPWHRRRRNRHRTVNSPTLDFLRG